jgi:hypothetical protein
MSKEVFPRMPSNPHVNRNRIAPHRAIQVIVALILIVIIGELSFMFHMPLLFAAVGPTTITVVSRPSLKQNRPISIVSTHYFGMAVALALLFLFHLYGAPSVLVAGFTQTRVLVAALAIGITTIFEEETPLYHPPAAATTLLVALGIMTSPLGLLSIVIGIALTAIGATFYEYFCPKESAEKVRRTVIEKSMS